MPLTLRGQSGDFNDLYCDPVEGTQSSGYLNIYAPTVDGDGNVETPPDPEQEKKEARDAINHHGFRYLLLEKREGGAKEDVIPFPSIPTGKAIRLVPASSIRYTLQDTPIREHSESRAWSILVRGMVGVFSSPQGRGGMRSLKTFDRAVHQYHKDARIEGQLYLNDDKQRVLRDRTWLEFWDLEDGVGWRVEFRGWDWDRGAMTRVKNAEWALSLQAYAPVNTVRARGGFDFRPRGMSKGTWEKTVEGVEQLRTAEVVAQSQMATAAYAIARGADVSALAPWVSAKEAILVRMDQLMVQIKSTPVVAGAEIIHDKMKLLGLAVESFSTTVAMTSSRFQGGVAAINTLPRSALINLIGAAQAVRAAITAVRSAGYAFTTLDTALAHQLRRTVSDILSFEDSTTTVLAQRGGTLPASFGVLSSTQPSFNPTWVQESTPEDEDGGGLILYSVRPGDTLESLALSLYGSSDLWTKIATFNRMSFAGVLQGGAQLQPGSQLSLPVAGAVGAFAPQALKKNDVYGTDWAIDPATGDRATDVQPFTTYDGVTYVTTSPQGTDWRTVSGASNLLQAVANRVRTVVGSCPAQPQYGAIPQAIGSQWSSSRIALTLASIQKQLGRDPRILRVAKVTPAPMVDGLRADVEIVPVSGGTVAVAAPLL